MIKWLYLFFCKVGLHRYEKVDINYSFGPGGSTETIKCKDCGIKKIIPTETISCIKVNCENLNLFF